MTHDTTLHANTLTQLSSREQLSALMDGALPADETRFLLRRLQHDAPLAECWERWRLTGEVMRGLAPAQRLPADFATRVALALQEAHAAPADLVASRGHRPDWWRRGGAAMAASLAVLVGFLAWQPAVDPVGDVSPQRVAVASVADPVVPSQPVPSLPAPASAADTLVAATAIAASARPVRNRDAARTAAATRVAPVADREGDLQAVAATLPIHVPQPDIVTRPWPRSVLPQYAGNNALAVGFGDHARAVAPYNPFQSPALAEIAPPAAVQPAPADMPVDAARQP